MTEQQVEAEAVVEAQPVITNTPPTYTPPAPTGGVVDRDFVGRQAPPFYDFAGSNMAGESLTECNQCRALVKESGQPAHSAFHGIVNGTANRVGMQAG